MLDSKPLDLPGDLEEGELAVYLAWLRIGAATAAFVAPGAVTRLWTGEDGPPTLTRTVLRSWAGREAALGIGLLMSLRHDKGVRGWLEGGALADASDALGALMSLQGLPRLRRLWLVAASAGAAVLEIRLAASFD